jgi:hypothetical protein
MQGADLIFFFQDKQNRFWGINASGNVTLSSDPYPIQFSPDGWDEIGIKNVRNLRYWAVDRTVTLQFKYVEDAARILKHIFYNRGVEESVYLVICELQLDYTAGVSYAYWYKQRFKSEVDLSTFDHAGAYITCNLLEDGLAKHLKSSENTVFEFDLNDSNAINVKQDGIVLTYKRNYTILQNQEVTGTANAFLGMVEISREGDSSSVAFSDVQVQASSPYPNSSYFALASANQPIRVQGRITLFMNKSVTPIIRLELNDGIAVGSTQTILYNTPQPAGATVNIDIDQTFTLPAGWRAYIKLLGGSPVDPSAQYTVIDKDLSFTYDYRFPTTYARAFRPQYLFGELIKKVTESEYTGEDCPYFGQLKHWNKVFTSGDGIRSIENAKLKISFSQFFDFFDTFDSVGIREKAKRVLFDRKKALTDDVNWIDLGTVSRPNIKFNKTFPYNELNIGYPDIKNETGVLNGKNEVNTTSYLSLGTTKSPRKYTKVSPVRVSCYDIENLRIATFAKQTTENKNDNEPYCLHISDTLIPASGDDPDHYELNRDYNAFVVSGVDQISSVYNLALSPKNCILNSGDYLRSCLYKCDAKTLKFLTADRNKTMNYVNGPVSIIEDADVDISSLDDSFFLPVSISAETDAPTDLLDNLDDNPIVGFKFTFENEVYKIISLENGINLKTLKKQTYLGLSHPGNNLAKLEAYYG